MADPLVDVAVGDDGVVGVTPVTPGVRGTVDTTEILPLANFIGITDPGGRQQSQLKEVWDFLSANAEGTGDLLYQFKQLENRMSPPKLGETRLSKVYRHVKLQKQIKEAENLRDSL